MPQVIENPHTGERIVISDNRGEVLVFEVFLQPGGHVPAGHIHPQQEERFTVLSGELRFRIGRQTSSVAAGETIAVKSGVRHWFGNPGSEVAHVRVEVRPALRMQELLATANDGLLDRALIPLDFRRELRVPYVPFWLLALALAPLGMARRLATKLR
jgi:quercetin dioxygenase-like cupin family protein